VELVGSQGVQVDDPAAPRQLIRPEGVQLENISPGHQHIDLIYFARPVSASGGTLPDVLEDMRWLDAGDLSSVELTTEVETWARKALEVLRSS
jgi:hypothetical protein